MKRKIYLLVAVALLIPSAFAKHPKIADDIDTSHDGAVDVIVQFKSSPATGNQASFAKSRGRLRSELGAARAALYSIPASALENLANDPDVAFIPPGRIVEGALDVAVKAVYASTGHANSFTGNGVGVAVIDSGVQAEPGELNVVYSQSFVVGQSSAKDYYGHGTHAAGIIAGSGAVSGAKYKGVAPGAKIINLRVLDGNNRGTGSAVIAAIGRAIQLETT